MEKLNKLKNVLKKSVKIGVAITLGTMLMGCPNLNGPEKTGKEQDNSSNEQYGIPYDVKLGNGNYFVHNFFGQGGVSIDMNMAKGVNHYLGKGETYVKGLVNQFSDSLKDRPAAEAYFAQFINEEQNNQFQRLDEQSTNPYSFDKTIKGVAQPSVYIFENIIRNIDNNHDRHYFRICYQTLATESFGYGLGHYKNVPSSQKDKYEYNREILNDAWATDLINNPFDLNQDIDQQKCQQITNEIDNMLARVVASMGNDVTVSDLQQVINIAMTANSLAAMHDISASALKHTSCSAEINPVKAMQEVAREMYQAEQQQGMSK
ncbi:MAG: hypothetical protein E7060_02045 [Treponema bryantii]|nr:hypothetical protein [Treponema bryantii]